MTIATNLTITNHDAFAEFRTKLNNVIHHDDNVKTAMGKLRDDELDVFCLCFNGKKGKDVLALVKEYMSTAFDCVCPFPNVMTLTRKGKTLILKTYQNAEHSVVEDAQTYGQNITGISQMNLVISNNLRRMYAYYGESVARDVQDNCYSMFVAEMYKF